NENEIINETSAGSPLIADCRQIIKNISKGATWSYSTAQRHRKLVSHASCALGIERDGGESKAETAKVGNTDVEDIINGLAKLAEKRGDIRMGGKVSMKCQNLVQMRRVKIWFAVYH
ncbi:Ecp2 effector protein, partial [Sordaria brevicollis]